MSYQNITLEIKNKTAQITINREGKLNALNRDTIAELKDAVSRAETDGSVRGLILTGAGEKAVVDGADIKEILGKSREEAEAMSRSGHELMNKIANLSKPVVAAINGFALGGGLELALACHFRVASSTANMGLPEVSLGLIPGYGGTQRLPELIGKGRALELILTGEMVDAQAAYRWGLVSSIVDPHLLIEQSQKLLERIYSRSASAVSAAIVAVNGSTEGKVDGYGLEIRTFAECFVSEDFTEGLSAFTEKRKPRF